MRRPTTVPELPESMRAIFRAWIAREAETSQLLDVLETGIVRHSPVCFGGEHYWLSPADRGLVRAELLVRIERAGGTIKLRRATLTTINGQLQVKLPWRTHDPL